MRGDDGPSPVSASENLLERIHDEDTPEYEDQLDEARQELIDLERDMALVLSKHSLISMTQEEVLRACNYETVELIDAYRELYITEAE